MPPFCFSYPLPQSAQFSVMFPLLELRICQTSHFFLAFISVYFFFPLMFSLFSYSWFFHILGISLLVGLCVHSLPSSPPSLPPSHFCPFLFKSHQGSFEGPQRRPWRGAGRKGCGRPHCSSLLCCTDSDTSSLWHTHHITHKIGHTRCVESLTPCSLSPRRRGVFSWYQGCPFLSTDSFVFYHVSEDHWTPVSKVSKGRKTERERLEQ